MRQVDRRVPHRFKGAHLSVRLFQKERRIRIRRRQRCRDKYKNPQLISHHFVSVAPVLPSRVARITTMRAESSDTGAPVQAL